MTPKVIASTATIRRADTQVHNLYLRRVNIFPSSGLDIEPLSVTPFSPRARDRGLSGVLAAYIRQLGQEFNDNQGAGRVTREHPFVQAALDDISRQAMQIEGSGALDDDVHKELEVRIDEWLARAQQVSGGGAQLGYRRADKGTTTNLLQSADTGKWDKFTCLNSLRDVEPSVGLILDEFGMDREPHQAGAPTGEEGETS